MAYPDTDLQSDQLDAEYGGRPIDEFGVPAWQWINAVVRFLAQAYLTYARAPYATVVAVSQSSAVAGDVAVVSQSTFVPAGGYYVAKYASGLPAKRFYGVFLEGIGVGAKARIAAGGIIPATVTGLPSTGADAPVGIDPTTGRLRLAQTGDVIVGSVDGQGNVLLTAPGVAL
jgi:hypothetical protein